MNRTKRFLTRPLPRIGIFPTSVTKMRDFRSFLESLHPVAPEKPLIRLGGGDGGYLVPDDLEGIAACFSPGVSTESDFEIDCAGRGMQVFLADASVAGPSRHHENFTFIPKFVGPVASGGRITLDEWVAQSLPDEASELMLQMDIEGDEYTVFPAISERLMQRLRIIVVEFHRLELLGCEPYFKLARTAFDKILCTHACVHIHPNNAEAVKKYRGIPIPPLLEFTFLRRDRLGLNGYRSDFPHPLDRDNTPSPPVALPRAWYR